MSINGKFQVVGSYNLLGSYIMRNFTVIIYNAIYYSLNSKGKNEISNLW